MVEHVPFRRLEFAKRATCSERHAYPALELANILVQIPGVSQPSFIRPHAGGSYLAVKLQPRASTNEVCEPLGDELKIKVTAPPVDAAANQALIDLLSETLKCSRGKIQILRGQTSRHKTIWIEGKTVEEVLKSLSPVKSR